MTAVQQTTDPRNWADIAKDVVIMLALSAVIIAGLTVLKDVLPPI